MMKPTAVFCRAAALLGASLLLSACPSSKPVSPSTTAAPAPVFPPHPHGTQPVGAAFPENTVQHGGNAAYRAVSLHELPQWQHQPFADSLRQFWQSCTKLHQQADWAYVCRQAAATAPEHQAAKQFFEQHFTAWQVSQDGKLGGTITGYYEPILTGDTQATAKARFPIYGIPSDLITVSLPAHLRNSKATVRIQPGSNGQASISEHGSHTADLSQFPINERSSTLKGRFDGNRFLPYYTRADINAGALNGIAPILGYADDPVELFFLQIQGSGRLKTPNGSFIRLGYADKNEYPYVSIGRYMADKGYLPLAQTSMQGIKKWIAQNPHKMAEILGQNPSFVFFRRLNSDNDGPIGALGVPLAGGLSGAVDRRYITLGAPLFLATTHPDTRYALNRLIMAQDTGSAIKGAVRVDYFWGYGDAAGQSAGKMKDTGYVWQLLPHGVLPQYRD